MNRVTPGLLGRRDNLFAIEIRRHADTAQRTRFIGLARVKRIDVVFSEDRDSSDAHLGRGSHNTNRNLTPVRDEKTARNHVTRFTSGSRLRWLAQILVLWPICHVKHERASQRKWRTYANS